MSYYDIQPKHTEQDRIPRKLRMMSKHQRDQPSIFNDNYNCQNV